MKFFTQFVSPMTEEKQVSSGSGSRRQSRLSKPHRKAACSLILVEDFNKRMSESRLEDKARQVSHESHLKSHPKSQRTLIQIRRLGNYSGPSTSKGTETFTSNKNRLPQMRFRTRR